MPSGLEILQKVLPFHDGGSGLKILVMLIKPDMQNFEFGLVRCVFDAAGRPVGAGETVSTKPASPFH